MGVSHFDKSGSHRKLEAIYALTTPRGVGKLLNRWDAFIVAPFDTGDYGAVDLKLDMETALTLAVLTPKQRTAVELVYMRGFRQEEVAELLKVEQSSISRLLATAKRKIADVFKEWAYNEWRVT